MKQIPKARKTLNKDYEINNYRGTFKGKVENFRAIVRADETLEEDIRTALLAAAEMGIYSFMLNDLLDYRDITDENVKKEWSAATDLAGDYPSEIHLVAMYINPEDFEGYTGWEKDNINDLLRPWIS